MEQNILQMMSAAGGFAGVVVFALIYYIGRRLVFVEQAMTALNRMDLMRIAASPHISDEVKRAVAEELKALEKRAEASK